MDFGLLRAHVYLIHSKAPNKYKKPTCRLMGDRIRNLSSKQSSQLERTQLESLHCVSVQYTWTLRTSLGNNYSLFQEQGSTFLIRKLNSLFIPLLSILKFIHHKAGVWILNCFYSFSPSFSDHKCQHLSHPYSSKKSSYFSTFFKILFLKKETERKREREKLIIAQSSKLPTQLPKAEARSTR